MTTLCLFLALVGQTLPAPNVNANVVYCQQIVIGDPVGVRAVVVPQGVLFLRANGRAWCELSMENATDYPQIRLISEYLPQQTITIRCTAAGGTVEVSSGAQTVQILAGLVVPVSGASSAPAASVPVGASPPAVPQILMQPWE